MEITYLGNIIDEYMQNIPMFAGVEIKRANGNKNETLHQSVLSPTVSLTAIAIGECSEKISFAVAKTGAAKASADARRKRLELEQTATMTVSNEIRCFETLVGFC